MIYLNCKTQDIVCMLMMFWYKYFIEYKIALLKYLCKNKYFMSQMAMTPYIKNLEILIGTNYK